MCVRLLRYYLPHSYVLNQPRRCEKCPIAALAQSPTDWKLATRLRLWSPHHTRLKALKLPFLRSARVTHGLCALDYCTTNGCRYLVPFYCSAGSLTSSLFHESSSPYLKGTGKFGNVEMITLQTEGRRDRESTNTVIANQLLTILAACVVYSTLTTSFLSTLMKRKMMKATCTCSGPTISNKSSSVSVCDDKRSSRL
jgi:hypothetical protein